MISLALSNPGWVLAAVQIVGLASAVLARLSERSACQTWCQWLFLLCLCLVGLATAISLSGGPGNCLICGSTLSMMSVTAVYDFSSEVRLEVF